MLSYTNRQSLPQAQHLKFSYQMYIFLLRPMIQIGINLQTNDLNQCCRIRIIGIFTVWIRKLLTKRNVLTFLIALFKGSQIANRIKMTCSGKKFPARFSFPLSQTLVLLLHLKYWIFDTAAYNASRMPESYLCRQLRYEHLIQALPHKKYCKTAAIS